MSNDHTTTAPLLRVQDLRTYFPVRSGRFGTTRRVVKSVDGVSFELHRGKTLGLVGESGCGKTTLARTVLRLTAATSGTVTFDGQDVFAMAPRDVRRLRRHMQIVFQDPVGSLNPRLRVGTIVGEAPVVHGLVHSAAEADRLVADLLTRVGLSPDDRYRYPHEFSGGQRQRIGIARALALQPSLIVCDEPISALDVSIQAQILNLLADLQHDLGLTYLFIAHDLAVVRHVSDNVAVMYLGKIVEQAPTSQLFSDPRHPYTRALLASAPDFVPLGDAGTPRMLAGEPPSPIDPPPGCAFHPRCPIAVGECGRSTPVLETPAGLPADHRVACFRADERTEARESPAPTRQTSNADGS